MLNHKSKIRNRKSLIGIGGVSRSGKTTLAKWLASQLPNACILHQDDFTKPINNIPKIKGTPDWDHPGSIDWVKWSKAIDNSSEKYQYVIIEGIFAFYNELLTQRMNHRIFLSIDKKKFIHLRKKEDRWGHEPDWYIAHAWDAHLIYGALPKTGNYLKYHNILTTDYPAILKKVV